MNLLAAAHQGKLQSKFGGYRHCSSEDIMVLVYYVILQHHVIKGSCCFMGRKFVETYLQISNHL